MESFLRWAGSKRQALAALKKCLPPKYERYIEPFAGSASLFFDLTPNEAILGDLNAELISTLRSVQTNIDRVLDCLDRMPKTDFLYYQVRSMNPSQLCETELAARFIYLNHFC